MPCVVEIEYRVKSPSGTDSHVSATKKRLFKADELTSLGFSREINDFLNITGNKFKRITLPNGWVEIQTPASSLTFWRYRIVTGNDAVLDDVYVYR